MEQDIHRVAIYGIAELGQRLYDELVESGIKVEYIIDNNPNVIFYDYKIVSMKDDFLPVDAIIVTPILFYDEIKNEIKKKKISYPIISLKQLGCHRYLSGVGARDYFVQELYDEAGVEVIWQDFQHPVYKQQFGDFIPYLSSIDLLFNCGIEESRRILRRE